MKIRFTDKYLALTGEENRVFETRKCEVAKTQSKRTKEGIMDVYLCTTEPATYLCRPENYPGCKFHHIHASNVEPCDPEPSQGQEPLPQQQVEAKPCIVDPTDASTSRSELSETKKEPT
jgi:hypothetical protein